jgi:F-type H+-transporting ATPase subunit gamma
MAHAKEIRTKITSIKKTQKITSAMEMVAASKMRKTQDAMGASKPYASRMYAVIKHVAQASAEYKHPFMVTRPIKRVGVIVVTSDRGLCGGLNVNVFKETLQYMRQWQDTGYAVDLCIIGRKGQAFFKRFGGHVLATLDGLGDTPHVQDLVGVIKTMLDTFERGDMDALYIVHNEFINTMTIRPKLYPLLPISLLSTAEKKEYPWDYIYEPDARMLLDALLKRYIEAQVYQAVVENIACEQASKMVAMKSATDNAGELIKEFQLAYNKARQAAITQELAEIVGGADAL